MAESRKVIAATSVELLELWRVADAKAARDEAAVHRELLRKIDGQGPGPSPELENSAKAARKAADELFARAVGNGEPAVRPPKR